MHLLIPIFHIFYHQNTRYRHDLSRTVIFGNQKRTLRTVRRVRVFLFTQILYQGAADGAGTGGEVAEHGLDLFAETNFVEVAAEDHGI